MSFPGLLRTFFEKKHGLVDIWSQVAWDFAFNLSLLRGELLELETIAKFLDASYSLDDFRAYIDARILVSNELFYKSPPQLKILTRDECKKVSKAFILQVIGDAKFLGKFWSFVRNWFTNGNDAMELTRWLAFVTHFFHAVYMHLLPTSSFAASSPGTSMTDFRSPPEPSSAAIWSDSSPREARLLAKIREMQSQDSHRLSSPNSRVRSPIRSPPASDSDRRRNDRQSAHFQEPPHRPVSHHARQLSPPRSVYQPNRSPGPSAHDAGDISAIENVNADMSLNVARVQQSDLTESSSSAEQKTADKEKEDIFFELEWLIMNYPKCVQLSVDEPSFFLDFLYRFAAQCHAYVLVLTHGVSYFGHAAFQKVSATLCLRVAEIFDALVEDKTELIPRNLPYPLSDLLQRHREAVANLSLSMDSALSSVNEMFDRECKAIIASSHVRDEVEPACAFAVYSIESVQGVPGDENIMHLLEPVADNRADEEVAVQEAEHVADASEI